MAVPGGTEVRAVTAVVAGESRTVAGKEGPRCHFWKEKAWLANAK